MDTDNAVIVAVARLEEKVDGLREILNLGDTTARASLAVVEARLAHTDSTVVDLAVKIGHQQQQVEANGRKIQAARWMGAGVAAGAAVGGSSLVMYAERTLGLL